MLGRSVGLSEEQMEHLADNPLPAGVYTEADAAIVRYSQTSTLTIKIDDALYADLEKHFNTEQIIDLCFTVGLSNMVNRYHATFLTDVDESTLEAVEQGTPAGSACPIPIPTQPVDARYATAAR